MSADLNELFEIFPRLRFKLREIYNSTLEFRYRGGRVGTENGLHTHGGLKSGVMTNGRLDAKHTPEKAFRVGLARLNDAMLEGHQDSEALQEFSALILRHVPPDA